MLNRLDTRSMGFRKSRPGPQKALLEPPRGVEKRVRTRYAEQNVAVLLCQQFSSTSKVFGLTLLPLPLTKCVACV